MTSRVVAVLVLFALGSSAAEDQIAPFRRGLYRSPKVPQVSLTNSPRIDALIRAGNLYLSLRDAIALAIENNLDVEFERLNTPIAETEQLRAEGGGTLRGIGTQVNEVPAGLGGPQAPLLTAAAGGGAPATALPGYSSDLSIITELPTNNSIASTFGYAAGPPIPAFDPALTGGILAEHTSTPETNVLIAGSPNPVERTVSANLGYSQGFSPGTQIQANFNNSFNNSSATNAVINPYVSSNLGVMVTQPLLRGFGIALNRRFIRISKNNEKVTDLVFKEQLISTVSGVIRLYQDLVALNDDVTNRRQTLSLALRLYEDNKNQVDVGTLAPVEATRAEAQVAGARQDLINAEGFVEQQELILKSVLTKRFTSDPQIRAAHIVPTDSIEQPREGPLPELNELIEEANRNRPDLLFAGIQVDNANIYLEGSRNALKPELDLVGIAQNSGLAGPMNPAYVASVASPLTGSDLANVGNYGNALSQIATRAYPTYGVGLNLTLPLRNRVAEADAVRDELQLRQTQVRRQQLINAVRLEVEDALVALNRTKAAYDAAVQARQLQEESLAVEQERYAAGLSTTFLVLTYQSYVAQARTTEIAARSAYAKARTALDRAVGMTLEDNGVSVAAAYRGQM